MEKLVDVEYGAIGNYNKENIYIPMFEYDLLWK